MTPNDPRNPYGAYGPPPQQPYPPYPPAPYAPPYAYPMQVAPSNDGDATTIFILGLLGLVFCQLLAPIAWIKGGSYRTTCQLMGAAPNGMATAGWVMGIVGTVMFALSLVLLLVMVLVS